jgi:hypothetical protein
MNEPLVPRFSTLVPPSAFSFILRLFVVVQDPLCRALEIVELPVIH